MKVAEAVADSLLGESTRETCQPTKSGYKFLNWTRYARRASSAKRFLGSGGGVRLKTVDDKGLYTKKHRGK